jgi:hypothetical protein
MEESDEKYKETAITPLLEQAAVDRGYPYVIR